MVRAAALVACLAALMGISPAAPAAEVGDSVVTLTAPYAEATVSEVASCFRMELCSTDAAATAGTGAVTLSTLTRSAGAGVDAAGQCQTNHSTEATGTIVASYFLQEQLKRVDTTLTFTVDDSLSNANVPFGFPMESRAISISLLHASCSDCGRATYQVAPNTSNPSQLSVNLSLERLNNKLVPPGQITIKAVTRAISQLNPRITGPTCAMAGEVASQVSTTLSNITLTLTQP